MTFKPGDKVVCIDAGAYTSLLTVGREYKIEQVDNNNMVWVRSNGGQLCVFYVRKFELVSPSTPFEIDLRSYLKSELGY